MSANARSSTEDFPRYGIDAYLADKAVALLIFAFCLMAALSSLAIFGVTIDGILLIGALMLICFISALAFDFQRKRAYYLELYRLLGKLENASAFDTFFAEPSFLDGNINYATGSTLSRMSARSITEMKEAEEAYRRYIELWIHEIKTPIAAMKLILANRSDEQAAKMSREIERVENQVEQALYYARSTAVANDYAIKEVPLSEVVREVCKRNARFLIEHKATPVIEVPDDLSVLTDEAWIVFMIGQVVVNSAKYGATTITFRSSVIDEGTASGRTVLEIADDGCGIPAGDVSRVFERGFIGDVGRSRGSATGMGLYLVAKLCASLGLHVGLASEEGVGTRVIFTFPHDRARKRAMAL